MKFPKSIIGGVRLGVGLFMGFSGIILLLVAVVISFEIVWIPIAGVALLVGGLALAGPKRLIEFLLSLPSV
ncbi:MAG TPA: hypothetical protein VM581_02035 [Magnetospirillaceae bacterium]|nr:hypothetical protein [Magnetospirillaceae bacterium]